MSLLTSQGWTFFCAKTLFGFNVLLNIETDYYFYLNVESYYTFVCETLPYIEWYSNIRSVTKKKTKHFLFFPVENIRNPKTDDRR